jgi:hypothetical protein
MQQGSIVYQGLAYDAPNYFRNLGHKITTMENPSDIFLKVLATNYPLEKEDYEKLEFYQDKYKTLMAKSVNEESFDF